MELNSVWSAKDLIMAGLAYTVMGMLVVFLILIIIMFAIKAMAVLGGSEEKSTEKAEEKPKEAPVSASVPAKNQEDDGELIAVITAAIASMLTENSATGFRIRSYKRVQDDEWNKAGRREFLNNRF